MKATVDHRFRPVGAPAVLIARAGAPTAPELLDLGGWSTAEALDFLDAIHKELAEVSLFAERGGLCIEIFEAATGRMVASSFDRPHSASAPIIMRGSGGRARCR